MHLLLFLSLFGEPRDFHFPGCEYGPFQEQKIFKKLRPYFREMGPYFHIPQEVICNSTK